MRQKVKTALISVSDKTGVVDFARFLHKNGIAIISTGGTAKALRKAKIKVIDISDYTGFPEIMDGRVKTLHPKVHGGLLAKRSDKKHKEAMKKHDIPPIDMVVVNLYPFGETVAKGAGAEECIENIDIGGPSMIRSAAKNHKHVVVVVNPSDYQEIIEEMKDMKGATGIGLRRKLAARAFARTACYDAAIGNWFAAELKDTFPASFNLTATHKATLRYGENPHQQAALYVTDKNIAGIASAEQLQGKELSYNNISDADAAYELVNEFAFPAAAIIKHANPCGVASAKHLARAFEKALSCDPVSAYGSIVAFNKPVDEATAEMLDKMFVEVIIAPDAGERARNIFSRKKNLRLLLTGEMPERERKTLLAKTITGGLLLQERDHLPIDNKDLKIVTKRKPSRDEIDEMLFAFRVCKHVKSNAIVLTKDHKTVGIGAGQMSRVDSVRIAAWKSGDREHKTSNEGLALASDAFFPFADGVISAHDAGVSCIIQPGGSIRDDEVIKAADDRDIAMVFTNKRHFRH